MLQYSAGQAGEGSRKPSTGARRKPPGRACRSRRPRRRQPRGTCPGRGRRDGRDPSRGHGGTTRPKGRRGRRTHLSPPCPSSITWDQRPYAPTCPAAGEAARLSPLGQGRRGLRRRRPLRSRLRLLRCGRSCRVPPPLAGSAGLCRAVPSSFVFLHPRPPLPPPVNYCSLSITPPGCAGRLALPPPPKTPATTPAAGGCQAAPAGKAASGRGQQEQPGCTRSGQPCASFLHGAPLRLLPPRPPAPRPPPPPHRTGLEIRIRVFAAAPRRVSPPARTDTVAAPRAAAHAPPRSPRAPPGPARPARAPARRHWPAPRCHSRPARPAPPRAPHRPGAPARARGAPGPRISRRAPSRPGPV